ncbi:FkbM family methyltransferase [Methylobacterium phyllosphaerae]
MAIKSNIKRRVLLAYRLLMRALEPNSGLTVLSFNPLVNWLFEDVIAPMEATTREGFLFFVDPQEYHGRILWIFGSNDLKTSRVVNGMLDRNDILLDIGANYATIGLASLSHIGTGGQLHLFEPQPSLAAQISGVIRQHRLHNVQLHQYALSSQNGHFEMSVNRAHSGIATLLDRREVFPKVKDGWSQITVKCVEARKAVQDCTKGGPFGAKVDVEGAEPDILRALLECSNLLFVVLEGDKNIDLLFDILTKRDFAVFGLRRTLISPRLCRIFNLQDWSRFHDFLAVPARAAVPGKSIRLERVAAELAAVRRDILNSGNSRLYLDHPNRQTSG